LPNILFICSKNQWRSPTAELLFKNHPVYQARSAGTGQQARTRVNEKLINKISGRPLAKKLLLCLTLRITIALTTRNW
jgi:protein-tyrosine-phosphatase